MLRIKPSEARKYADIVAASIDEENRQLVEYKLQLSTALEEKLQPAKTQKHSYAAQQAEILRMRKQNDDLAQTPSEQEKSLLARLESLREQHKRELSLLEVATRELEEERTRAKRLDEKIAEIEEHRQAEVAKMRELVKSYEDVLALCIEPYAKGGLKITYTDLRRSFVLRHKADDSDETEIVGVGGCEQIAAEFNRRRNVGALLYRMRETLKNRSSAA